MRMTGIEAARMFIERYFPDCELAFLAGSVARGEETQSSDLDVVIFHSKVMDYRESFEQFGWRIECFVSHSTLYEKRFSSDKASGRPIFASMLVEGLILKDVKEQGLVIQEAAREFIKQGPDRLTEEYIKASRYFLYDLLDDFLDASDDGEALLTLNTLSIQLADFILRLNGSWSGRGKTLMRALKKLDQQKSKEFLSALQSYYLDQNKQPIADFVHHVYEPLGGQLFAGFSMGKN